MRNSSLLVGIFVLLGLGCGEVVPAGPDAGPDAPTDPCETNTCECEVDGDCDSFEVCDTTSTPGRLCVCAAAYSDSGSGCAFAGAPADPGFEADDVWIASAPLFTSFDVAAAGFVDPGEATLLPAGVCELATLSQTFEMPPFARAQPLVGQVSYKLAGGIFDSMAPAILLNGRYNELPAHSDNYSVETFCLGEAAYGGDVEFTLSVRNKMFSCTSTPAESFSFDRFDVRVANSNECPTSVGETINGDFEGTSGWTYAVGGGGTADYMAGVGASGTTGARLTRTTTASRALATSTVSLPLDSTTPNAAIEVFTAGTVSAVVEVSLGQYPLSRFNPPGVRRVCIPDWAKGTVQQITVGLPSIMTSGTPIGRSETVDIDAIAIVSDPGCSDDPNQYDNGFETLLSGTGLAPGWAVTEGGVNGVLAPAEILTDAASAQEGTRSARFIATNVCNTALATRTITVPASAGAAGPAVKAFVNVIAAPTGRAGLRMFPGTALLEAVAAEGVGYNQVTLCIPPEFSGRAVRIDAFGSGGGGGCTNIPAETSFIDAIEIGTDATCPAN